MTRVEELELALAVAINILSVYEHGDSRCISDEFVALCCVSVNSINDSCVEILTRARDADYSAAREEDLKYIHS